MYILESFNMNITSDFFHYKIIFKISRKIKYWVENLIFFFIHTLDTVAGQFSFLLVLIVTIDCKNWF